MIEVIKPGLLTLFQDSGRPGFAHLGVGRSGAFDEPALQIANALCGNPRDVCALEITLAGPCLRVREATCIAVTGAPIPFRIDGVEQPMWAPVPVPAGALIELGSMRRGCRNYLAVRGGFDVAPVLGSRSTDVNAGLGPNCGRPLRNGDTLPAGSGSFFRRSRRADEKAGENEFGPVPDPISKRGRPTWWIDPRPWFGQETQQPLRLLPGKHLDALTEASREALFSGMFRVHADSNRTGLRLDGPALECARPIEMISEGCVPGLLQLPPSGRPIAFGPECPVSGGYPRIGQIAAVDIPRLAQLRPGDAVRFMPCTFEDARHALRKRERMLDTLTANIATRLAP